MDINQVHVPHRLEGEEQYAYNIRRRMSARLQERCKVVFVPNKVYSHAIASHAQAQKRALTAAIGPRQARKAIRAARALQKEAANA